MPRAAKELAYLLLLASLAFPLTRCSYAAADNPIPRLTARPTPDKEGAAEPQATAPSSKAGKAGDYDFWIVTGFRLSEGVSWVVFGVFLWPLPILAARRLGLRGPVNTALAWLEIPLAALSGVILYVAATIFGRPRVGGYLGLAAISLYFSAALIERVNANRPRKGVSDL